MTKKSIEAVSAFWNSNPCDGQPDIAQRMRYRYRKEPWLKTVLETVALRDGALLEAGCGQGTDSIYLCSLKKKGSYTSIDISGKSIEKAREAAVQFAGKLAIVPVYKIGNAECIEFPDASFDTVYSCGVLHHSPDTLKAIEEVYRVLKKGGRAYIYLYRTASPKVFIARVLRFISRTVDGITFQDRLIWKIIKKSGSDHRFGTMLLECFGVPILKSYTKGQIREMFSRFQNVEIGISGIGIPGTDINRMLDNYGKQFFGTMWQIICKK
jgi:ubiquinone/menaquinone biosynthesis C-methylase UbiE